MARVARRRVPSGSWDRRTVSSRALMISSSEWARTRCKLLKQWLTRSSFRSPKISFKVSKRMACSSVVQAPTNGSSVRQSNRNGGIRSSAADGIQVKAFLTAKGYFQYVNIGGIVEAYVSKLDGSTSDNNHVDN